MHPSKEDHVSTRIARALAALVVAGSLAAIAATAAPAAEVSTYLSRTNYLNEPCSGTWYRVSQTGLTADPNGWHSAAQYVRTDVGGNLETNVYVENGVNRFDRGYACTSSSKYRRIDSPTRYVHRYIYQNWLCYGASCQYMYTNTGSWLAGTVF
jgi:hypothetical protein